ncbi:C40 family peptidase [Rhodococcus triatomae]|uniref:NlpC/P60 family protein n=1 Tax=Rhodococcus triatomae TaxID=300028 RepID=A0A1G8FI57_9NOCA|nr:C40 family peptidase [Rhodococcus triatomae]QNG19491.1 C40 family peptidase [Rhodococcus triatomae]QNG24594.1 C40 family peptidase [Rhodococcus triatomae]SDH81834.1 NlpC/P60 family protein [Rhodococcus triatomae]
MIPIDLLARPILDLLGTFGSGVLPGGGPTDALRATSTTIDSVHDTGRAGISTVYSDWRGDGGTAAIVKTEEAQRSAGRISDRGNDMATVVAEASEIVRAGMVELEGILQSFLSLAAAAGPVLATPPGLAMIISAAVDHLGRATAVVARVRAELDQYTAQMVALTPAEDTPAAPTDPAAAAATAPAAATTAAAAGPGSVAQAASTVAQSAGGSMSSLFAPASSIAGGGGTRTATAGGLGTGGTTSPGGRTDSGFQGEGVEVVLPDGSTAVAPNQAAADAVRNALTQQGVPYVWGGTNPGQGLDCSGLTQWAYGEAGVGIPRLAQEQNVGTAVDPDSLMPGDLAIWDGHVAMVIGNGQLVEAGDPVQTGPIRTSNSGMAFKGFYRPTE